mmetsp:Transcript_27003/g.62348  ORF Transcript_27003/g.62348 Transcript_27003/m.62348 type:complete len:208 (+) Transcript_27003:513-1136(+)
MRILEARKQQSFQSWMQRVQPQGQLHQKHGTSTLDKHTCLRPLHRTTWTEADFAWRQHCRILWQSSMGMTWLFGRSCRTSITELWQRSEVKKPPTRTQRSTRLSSSKSYKATLRDIIVRTIPTILATQSCRARMRRTSRGLWRTMRSTCKMHLMHTRSDSVSRSTQLQFRPRGNWLIGTKAADAKILSRSAGSTGHKRRGPRSLTHL